MIFKLNYERVEEKLKNLHPHHITGRGLMKR